MRFVGPVLLDKEGKATVSQTLEALLDRYNSPEKVSAYTKAVLDAYGLDSSAAPVSTLDAKIYKCYEPAGHIRTFITTVRIPTEQVVPLLHTYGTAATKSEPPPCCILADNITQTSTSSAATYNRPVLKAGLPSLDIGIDTGSASAQKLCKLAAVIQYNGQTVSNHRQVNDLVRALYSTAMLLCMAHIMWCHMNNTVTHVIDAKARHAYLFHALACKQQPLSCGGTMHASDDATLKHSIPSQLIHPPPDTTCKQPACHQQRPCTSPERKQHLRSIQQPAWLQHTMRYTLCRMIARARRCQMDRHYSRIKSERTSHTWRAYLNNAHGRSSKAARQHMIATMTSSYRVRCKLVLLKNLRELRTRHMHDVINQSDVVAHCNTQSAQDNSPSVADPGIITDRLVREDGTQHMIKTGGGAQPYEIHTEANARLEAPHHLYV